MPFQVYNVHSPLHEVLSTQKSQFILLILSVGDTANFRFLRPEWPHPFFITPTPILSNQLLTSINLYQHAKIQTFSSMCSGDTVNLKMLQSYWPRAF